MDAVISQIDPDVLLSLFATFGLFLTALFTWVARALVRYLTGLLNIKLDQSAWTKVDWVAARAALATEQAFKKALMPAQHPEERALEKMAHAKQTARSLLPPAIQEKVKDEQLEVVIEAHVATLPPPAAVGAKQPTLTSLLPPPNL